MWMLHISPPIFWMLFRFYYIYKFQILRWLIVKRWSLVFSKVPLWWFEVIIFRIFPLWIVIQKFMEKKKIKIVSEESLLCRTLLGFPCMWITCFLLQSSLFCSIICDYASLVSLGVHLLGYVTASFKKSSSWILPGATAAWLTDVNVMMYHTV